MAKIFLWLSGLLLLGSVALGWLNTNRLGAVRQEKDQAVADAGAARTQADKARKDLTAVQTQLTAAKTISNEAQSKIDAANAEAARLQGELTTNQTQLTAVQTELTELKNRVAPANGIVTGGPAAGSGEDLQQKIHDLETRLAEFATVKKALDEQLRAADANVRQYQRAEQQRQLRMMRNGLTGSVVAVDRNWNFVVLDLGDRNGVVNNAEMVVTRSGSLVGRVRITSVEPSQSIADIVPNSVPPGMTVQRGDRVVFAGGGADEPPASGTPPTVRR